RLPVCRAEAALEVSGGHQRGARERRHVQRLRVVTVHPVTRSPQPDQVLHFHAHSIARATDNRGCEWTTAGARTRGGKTPARSTGHALTYSGDDRADLPRTGVPSWPGDQRAPVARTARASRRRAARRVQRLPAGRRAVARRAAREP